MGSKILVVVLFALCVAPSISGARYNGVPLVLKGSVYCDTCRCGFETDASTKLSGATVRVECKDRQSSELTYTKEAFTNSAGDYNVLIEDDRGDDYCDAVLVKSSDPECDTPNAGRDRARVILTTNNGISSNARFANPMGFLKNTPLSNCAQILQKYQEV